MVRQSAARARERARDQVRYARAMRERSHELTTRLINAWPSTHGLTAEGIGLADEAVHGRVLDAARRLFDACGSVSLTVVDQLGGEPRRFRTVASIGVAERVDAAQYLLGEGPCIEAIEVDMVAGVRADDFAADPESWSWPYLSEAAVALGVRSSLSIGVPWSAFRVGLQGQRRALGAINLYAREPHAVGWPESYVRGFGCWAGALASGREPAEIEHACS